MSDDRPFLDHPYGDTDDEFFQRIDRFGGWPIGKKWVTFEHSTDRKCSFTEAHIRTGWLTSTHSADDYYRWKLSPEAIEKIHREVYSKIASEFMRRARP